MVKETISETLGSFDYLKRLMAKEDFVRKEWFNILSFDVTVNLSTTNEFV